MQKINFSQVVSYLCGFLLISWFVFRTVILAVFAGTTINLTLVATPTAIALSPSNMVLNVGAAGSLVLTATYQDNSTADITNAPAELLTWSSSVPAVATINGGLVSSVSVGQTTITATYGDENSGPVIATALVVVQNPGSGGGGGGSNAPVPTLSFLSVEPNGAVLKIGTNQHFLAKAHYSDDSMVDVANDAVWSIDDPTIASVDHGLVLALHEGKTKLVALYGSKMDSAEIQVIADVPPVIPQDNPDNVQNLPPNSDPSNNNPVDGNNGDGQNNPVNGVNNGDNPANGGGSGQNVAQQIADIKFDQKLDKFLEQILYPAGVAPTNSVSRQETVAKVLDVFKLRSEKKILLDQAYADLRNAFSVFANFTSYKDFLAWENQPETGKNPLKQIYPDVLTDSKYYKDILDATLLGVVNGYFQETDSPFKPERIISHIEALKIILNAADLMKWKYYPELVASLGGTNAVEAQTTPFSDVSGKNQYMWWYPRYVNRACDLKIFECSKDGVFNPDVAITSQELNAWIERAATVSRDPVLLASLPQEQAYQNQFTDIYEGDYTAISSDDRDIFTNGLFTDPADPKALDKLIKLGVRITNFDENQIVADSQPMVKGFAPKGSTVEIILSNDIGHEKVLGQTVSDENSIFVFETPQPIRNGYYKLIARALVLDRKVVLESKPVHIHINSLLKVDPPKVKKISTQNISDDEVLKNVRVYIHDRKPIVTGVTGYGDKVIVTWRSLVMTSALVSDNVTGNFAVTTPRELEYGDHQVFVQAVRQSDGVLSKAVKLYFRINAQFDASQVAYNAVGSFINFVHAKIAVFIALLVLVGLGVGGYFWSRRVR